MGFQSQCGSQLKETFAEVGRGKPYLGNQRPDNGQTTKGTVVMSHVFVIDQEKRPLDPIHPGRARKLLSSGQAAVYRKFPFVLILKRQACESEERPKLMLTRIYGDSKEGI
jgi:hypothetical protein